MNLLPARGLSFEQIEKSAQAHLSSFDGFDNYESGPHQGFTHEYDGFGDDFVDFGGNLAASFMNEAKSGRVFTIVITNANVTDEKVILFPSYAPSSANKMKEGAFLSVGGNAMNAAGNPQSVDNLLAFHFNHPGRILGLKISSTDPTQLERNIKVIARSPYRDLESRTIFIANYVDPMQNRDKMAIVTEPLPLDDQSEVQIDVVKSSTLTLTLYVGAISNESKALEKKAGRAYQNISIKKALSGAQ